MEIKEHNEEVKRYYEIGHNFNIWKINDALIPEVGLLKVVQFAQDTPAKVTKPLTLGGT